MENKTNNTTKKPIYEALVFNGALSITNVFDAMKFCSLEDLQSYVENHKERTILKVELNGRDKNLVIWLSHNDIAHETPMGTKLGMVYLEESENKYAAFIGSDDSILCPIEVVLDMLIEEGAEIWLNDNLNEINYIFPGEDEETTLTTAILYTRTHSLISQVQHSCLPRCLSGLRSTKSRQKAR